MVIERACLPVFCCSIIPKLDCLDLGKEEEGVDMKRLFDVRREFWEDEFEEIRKYFEEQIGKDLPQAISDKLASLKARVDKLPV